jgi:hypothetical protein
MGTNTLSPAFAAWRMTRDARVQAERRLALAQLIAGAMGKDVPQALVLEVVDLLAREKRLLALAISE